MAKTLRLEVNRGRAWLPYAEIDVYADGTGLVRLLNSHRIDEDIGAEYHRFARSKAKVLELIGDWARESQRYPGVWRIKDRTPTPPKPKPAQEAQADAAPATP